MLVLWEGGLGVVHGLPHDPPHFLAKKPIRWIRRRFIHLNLDLHNSKIESPEDESYTPGD